MTGMVPLWMFLLVAAAMFCIGIYGVLSRRTAIAILLSLELMLNASIINLIAFWRFLTPGNISGQAFAVFVFVVAAAEAAIGLAIILSVYRNRKSVVVDDINLLKG